MKQNRLLQSIFFIAFALSISFTQSSSEPNSYKTEPTASNTDEHIVVINMKNLSISDLTDVNFKIGQRIKFVVNNIDTTQREKISISYKSYDYKQNSISERFTSILGINSATTRIEYLPNSELEITDLNFNDANEESIRVTFKNSPIFKSSNTTKIDQISNFSIDQQRAYLIGAYASTALNQTEDISLHFLSFQVADSDVSIIEIARYKEDNTTVIDKQIYTYNNYGGGGKLDFSAGIFITGLTDDVFNFKETCIQDTLYYQENFTSTDSISSINTINKKIIIKEDNNQFRIGIGVLAHYRTRAKSFCNVGASFGFEVDTDTNLAFLIGPSLLLGRQQRIVFTAGIALSQLKRLSNVYSENEIIDPSIELLSITTDIWAYKGFVSVTYNF